MKSVAFHNLGCKVNSYELDVMQQILQEKGYQIVPFDEIADIYIVNTCTVTNIADRKSRQMLHRAKQRNPEAIVVAVGCYVQTDEEGVKKDPCIDLAIGNNRKKDIAQILEQFLEERQDPACGKTLGGTSVIDINHTREYEEMQLKKTAEHTRAYIKIQDGCNQFCSYCAIPLARGRVRSRRAEDVLREVRGLVAAGYREVVLTGIHISSYGIDYDQDAWERGESQVGRDYRGSSRLMELVEQLHEIPGLERIRLGSLEPRIVTWENARKLAAMKKICPHFHLSLQSGCDETLKRMNRHYTTAQFRESVDYLRKAYEELWIQERDCLQPREVTVAEEMKDCSQPREATGAEEMDGRSRAGEKDDCPGPLPAITTDVIVGFPGETQEEFARTKAFLEEIRFYEMHVFKYSRRAGTRAAVMPDQVPDPVKNERSKELIEMVGRHSAAFRRKYLGKETRVLLEEKKTIGGRKYLLGHTRDYVQVAILCQKSGLPVENEVMEHSAYSAKAQEDAFRGRTVKVKVREFLTEEILLGDETDLF